MRRRLLLIVLVLLLGTIVCGPLFETVDHWDGFPQSGNDIVLTVLVAGISLGLALTLVSSFLMLLAAGFSTGLKALFSTLAFNRFAAASTPSFAAPSPPLALRI